MKYQNAFKCDNCPEKTGEEGCPAWNEIIMTNIQSGEDKIVKGCNFQLMPFIMTEAIKASNTSANTFADIKNEIARGYSRIAQAMPEFANRILLEKTTKED
jgi:hypothetical protein